MAWSPDGKVIGVAGEPPDIEFTEKELESYQAYFDRPHRSRLNSKQVDHPGKLCFFAADDGRLLGSTQGIDGGLAFAPDGSTVAGIAWTSVCIIDYHAGAVLARFDENRIALRSVCYSNDGQTLACFSSDGVHVFDARDASLLKTIPILENEPSFCDCERSEDEAVYIARFWSDILADFRPISCSDQGMELQRVCYCPTGNTAAVIPELHCSNVFVVDTLSIRVKQRLPTADRGIRTASFSPDGKYFAVAGDGQTIRIWELPTGNERNSIGIPPVALSSVAYSPAGRLIAAGNQNGDFGILDAEKSTLIHSYRSDGRAGFFLDFSPAEDHLAVGCRTGQVDIVTVPDLRVVTRFTTRHERFFGGMLSFDGTKFFGIFASDHNQQSQLCEAELIVWSVATGKIEISRMLPADFFVTSVCASTSRNQLAISSWSSILFADVSSDVRLGPLLKRKRNVAAIYKTAFIGDNQLLVANEGYGMAIIDTKREGSARSFVATRDGPTHLAIKGNLLARSTAYFKEIELFEISTGKLKKYLLGHQNHVTAIALAPNDTPRLASVGADGVLNIWDTNSGAIIHSIVPDLYQ